jgi:hypothetical protein
LGPLHLFGPSDGSAEHHRCKTTQGSHDRRADQFSLPEADSHQICSNFERQVVI